MSLYDIAILALGVVLIAQQFWGGSMKISEALHQAADEHLNDCKGNGGWIYSCDAIRHWGARSFVEELGVNSDSLSAFNEFREGPIRQGARYLWLKFAALVAESEGK